MTHLFEGIIEGLLIIFTLTFAVADEAVSISDKNENSTMVDPIQRGDISNTIRVQEDQSKLIRVEDFILLGFEETFWTERCGIGILLSLLSIKIIRVVGETCSVLVRSITFKHKVVVVLLLLTSAELLEHDHFVLTVLRGPCEQLLLLSVLGHVNDRSPVLFILCLETLKEFVETGVLFGHGFNASVQRLTRVTLLRLDEVLELFNFLDSLGPRLFHLKSFFLGVTEEQHAGLLVLVGIGVTEDSGGHVGHLGGELHLGVLEQSWSVNHLREKRHFVWLILIY